MRSIPIVRALSLSAAILPAAIFAPPAAAEAPEPPDRQEVDELKAELQALREQVLALQRQLEAYVSGAKAQAAPPGAAAPAGSAPTAAAPPGGPAAAAAPSGPQRAPSLLNPAISAVFQLIGDTSLGGRDDDNGFDLSEAEVAFESTVDPYAKMNLYLSFPADESPEVEEGYATTLALPASLQLKGGRFKSAFGKWNGLHTHAFPTVERPDALENFFGEESLANDGLSLSWLVPNPAGMYIDSTTEVGTAREGTSFNSAERALTWTEHLAFFFNAGDDDTIEVGATAAGGQTGPTETLLTDIENAGLTGTLDPDERLPSAVYGVDVTWKWKPLQQNTYRSFLWQTEALLSRRRAQVLDPALLLDETTISSAGGYSYVEGQWTKRWKIGLRYDLSGFPDSEVDRERGASGVVKFIPSEFQELRLQVKHTRFNESAAARFGEDEDDTRILFEWIPVIGAHGAHKY
jgi:hypothetical protein